ncbi:MAG: PAQR family membrane homeostasis protein TrhA [Candidatus Woesearchaeota archaeon]
MNQDQRINTITHLFATCLAVFGGAFLIVQSALTKDAYVIVAMSIYSASLILLFFASTLHHSFPASTLLKTLDYTSIFLLIGGTFTPFLLVYSRTPIGWTLFGSVWLLLLIGFFLRLFYSHLPKYITSTIYLTLGWFGFFLYLIIEQSLMLIQQVGIIAGGIFYTVGFLFFAFERPNTRQFGFHEIWHVFVIFGALAHYIAIFFIL